IVRYMSLVNNYASNNYLRTVPSRRSSDLRKADSRASCPDSCSYFPCLSVVLQAGCAPAATPRQQSDNTRAKPSIRFSRQSRHVRSEETRLNYSHVKITYADFCLHKKIILI